MHRLTRGAARLALAGAALAAAAAQGFAGQAPAAARAAGAPAAEVDRIRSELDALRQEYAGRMAALEARLAALEAARPAEPAATAAAAAATAVPPGAAGAEGTPGALPAYGGGTASSKVFNPDIAAIGDFVAAAGKSPGGGEPSLNLQESELSFQAVVDPYARADFFLTFGPEEVGVEEGYITFPTLPGGFLGKVGKMREAFGRVNTEHPHTLPYADLPLVSRNLLGGEALSDSGISVARLVPVPGFFLEATGQLYRGESDVFKAPTRGDLQYVGRLRGYRDISESTNLDLGGSVAYGNNGVTADSKTRLVGADLTLRYRPLRRSIYTNVLARGEAVWSRREEPAGTVDAFGAYGYLGYQFARRWTAGVRLDTSQRAALAGVRDRGGSFILSYRPSEFSLVRAQYRRTTFGQDSPANELLFQLLYSIGAHGAHPF